MHVVSREQMQAIDRYTVEDIGLGGPILMENAGRALAAALVGMLHDRDRVVIVIGKGNNGGDGFSLARQLLRRAVPPEVWVLPNAGEIHGDAALHMQAFCRSGGRLMQISGHPEQFNEQLQSADVIVDALLGTGASGAPRPEYAAVIGQLNKAQAAVVSVDVPSGIPANGESFAYAAVRADRTLTLQASKLAQFVLPAAAYFGQTQVLDIGIPAHAFSAIDVRRRVRTRADVQSSLPLRDPFAHKGTNGKGLLIAGSPLLPGAAFLAAKAALRSGIGLLTLAAPDSVRKSVAALLPEVMFTTQNDQAYDRFSAIAVGPGLGRSQEAERLVARALDAELPCVIDADGLYHLKAMINRLKSRQQPVVLSPHPGEMACLCDCSVSQVESDRFGCSASFAKAFRCYLVLKGKHTIVTAPDGSQYVNETGNAALAKGGSGDVLTGLLLAFLAQHRNPFEAAANAVYVHGAAADALVSGGHSLLDVLATDVIEQLSPVLSQLYKEKMPASADPSFVTE
ncbi:MAG: NAD(P)H-hydrate dehydratase [Sporolactobacillus sp.]